MKAIYKKKFLFESYGDAVRKFKDLKFKENHKTRLEKKTFGYVVYDFGENQPEKIK